MTTDPSTQAETHPGRPGSSKFGLGVFLAFICAFLCLASVILIWFGIIPGLVALFGALPLGIAAYRLIRGGRSATTLRADARREGRPRFSTACLPHRSGVLHERETVGRHRKRLTSRQCG